MDWLKKITPKLVIIIIVFSCIIGTADGAVSSAEVREINVIGEATSGLDQDQVYREALENGLRKAFNLARQADQRTSILIEPDQEKDLVTLQKEIGVVDFRVLRYWSEQNQFRVELRVWLGESQAQSPRIGALNRQPKIAWSSETVDQIEALSNYNLLLVVNTRQSLEIVNPDSGRLVRRIKTGFKPHLAYGDRYLVKKMEYLKVYSLNLINIYSFTDIWDQKLPYLIKYSLLGDTLYVVEQNGAVRAFNWDDGKEKWQLPAITRAEVIPGGESRVIIVIPTTELWAVNSNGQKIWVKKFESSLATNPVADNDDLFCFFNDGKLKVFDLETGRSVASWETEISGGLKQVNLSLGRNEVYILYNDLSNRGHLQVYHRWTGRLLWKVDWEEAVLPNLIRFADMVIVGLAGTFEARENIFGLKIWEERAIGRITGLYRDRENVLAVSGNRLYCYQLNME